MMKNKSNYASTKISNRRLISLLYQFCFSHIINLLTNMPKTCFEELLSPAVLEDENGNDEHNGKNMEAINIILRFLDHRITKAEVRRRKQQVEMKNFFNSNF